MKWFKLFSEARNDAKLRILNDSEFRTWFNLLCLAAEQKERGVIQDYGTELLAVEVCNGDADALKTVLDKLAKLRMVSVSEDFTITFLKFTDRQHDKPSDRPEQVAERVRRHRGKRQIPAQTQRDETPAPVDVTPHDEDVTLCNALCNADVTPQIREDKNRVEENISTITECSSYLAPNESAEVVASANSGKTKEPKTAIPRDHPLVLEICRITRIDLTRSTVHKGTRRHIYDMAKAFIADEVSLEQLREFERRWYLLDFRGQRRQPPKATEFLEQFQPLMSREDVPDGINQSNRQPNNGRAYETAGDRSNRKWEEAGQRLIEQSAILSGTH